MTQDEEDAGFPPALKRILSAHAPYKSRLMLSIVESNESNRMLDLAIIGTSIGKDDNDACDTPKLEGHQMTFSATPRKPRSTS